jgi:predicted RNA-binding protein associated with RNAse of E/G family
LNLDLFVFPDGRALLLDEDEYATLDLQRVEPAAHQAIQAALADLRARAAQGRFPFLSRTLMNTDFPDTCTSHSRKC